MRPRSRAWAALLALPVLLLLSSCMRMQVDVKITDIDHVSLTMNIGVDKALAAQSGKEITGQELCDGSEAKLGNATAEPYDDGKYIGCKMSVNSKVSETNKMVSFDEVKKIWTFSMPGNELSSGGQVSAGMVSDFKVTVTFPGKVLTKSGSGTISGNTVTWSNAADLFTNEGLNATAAADGAGLPSWIWIVVGIAVLAAVGALVYFFVLKKKPKAPTQPPYPGGAQPTFVPPTPQAPGERYIPAPTYQPPVVPAHPEAVMQGYQPPSQAFQPPSQTFQPPSQTFQPPSQTFQPPISNTQVPAQETQPPGQAYQPPTYQPPVQGEGH